MINIKIDEDTLLNMLVDRCDYWNMGDDVKALFEKMYSNYIDGGCFDGAEIDIMVIVDNDYINYCNVVYKGDADFKKLLKLYKNGEYDVSCKDFKEIHPSFIEAISDNEDMILIRY